MRRGLAVPTLAVIALLSGACGSKASSSPPTSAAVPLDPCTSVKAAQTALHANETAKARSDLSAALALAQQQGDGKIATAISNDVKLVSGATPNAHALATGDPLLNDCGF